MRTSGGGRRSGTAWSSLVFGALAMVLLVGCQSSQTVTGLAPSQSQTPTPSLSAPTSVGFEAPVSLTVSAGSLSTIQVTQHGTGAILPGTVAIGGATWTSSFPPLPGQTYDVVATLRDARGKVIPTTSSFVAAVVPDKQRLRLTIVPGDREVVGVGAPVVVRFAQPVTNREAVERALLVSSSTPVVGAWHWIGNREIHFRPKDYWPVGTKVDVRLRLAGVKAASDLWGGRDYSVAFVVGSSHIATVDATKFTFTPTVNGKPLGVWPTSMGRPDYATRNGTYIVLSKDDSIRMTSCSADITCDKKNPNYYDLTVNWDVRLTWSGTFVHSAPWSVVDQGSSNVSHGCVNLSPARAKQYFDMSRYGDVVVVRNSTRGPADLLRTGDPGMADWNMTWGAYVAGSALKQQLTTLPLATQQG